MSNTQTLTIAPAGTWELDAVHSAVGFEVEYLGGTFKGGFREIAATLVVGDDSVSLEGSAKVASVDVKDENLAAHLQSPEFFDVERYPELTFVSESVERSGDELKVHGELTIRGITKPLELDGTIADPMTDAFGRERVNITLDTSVDRTEFGLNWNMPLPNGQPALQNEVKLVAELYFVREA